jgi:hypothetical protein
MIFSPINLGALILEPLRYYFSTYTTGTTFIWDPDEKKRTVEVDYMNNLHKIVPNERPRILIDRGSYNIGKMSLTDNMAEQKRFSETMGLMDRINFLLYSGTATVTIEATQQGSCEILTDMAQHFLLWTKPYLCDTQGFKDFAYPMTVSSCDLDPQTEGKEKFRCTISVPWMREEEWSVKNDSIKIKDFIYNLTAAS